MYRVTRSSDASNHAKSASNVLEIYSTSGGWRANSVQMGQRVKCPNRVAIAGVMTYLHGKHYLRMSVPGTPTVAQTRRDPRAPFGGNAVTVELSAGQEPEPYRLSWSLRHFRAEWPLVAAFARRTEAGELQNRRALTGGRTSRTRTWSNSPDPRSNENETEIGNTFG